MTARQLLVECIRRDEESAKDAAGRGEDPEFYLERARGYRRDLAELKEQDALVIAHLTEDV